MSLLPNVTSLVDGTSTSGRPNASKVRDFNQAGKHPVSDSLTACPAMNPHWSLILHSPQFNTDRKLCNMWDVRHQLNDNFGKSLYKEKAWEPPLLSLLDSERDDSEAQIWPADQIWKKDSAYLLSSNVGVFSSDSEILILNCFPPNCFSRCLTNTWNLFKHFQLWAAATSHFCIALWENRVPQQCTQKLNVLTKHAIKSDYTDDWVKQQLTVIFIIDWSVVYSI